MTASTTAKGNAFRDQVATLLRTRYREVETEQSLGGTDVDIVFTTYLHGIKQTFAVECKDYASVLTKTYIAEKIWPHYAPMVQKGTVDHVMIVSRRPIGSDAESFLRETGKVSHRTLQRLTEELIGFRSYVEHLAKRPATDEAEYIEGRFQGDDRTALVSLNEWVESGVGNGVAILGGYGQGKTSFATRLASSYAQKYLTDSTARLPILIKLGEVVHETQLEGLFGKEFTSRFPSDGYNFATLQLLNETGRLLIVLDGFDEMKHAMTSIDFQATFRQFNRLLVGDAKVVLLGRPSALPTDERKLVFRGVTNVAGAEMQSATFKPWREQRLDIFDRAETERLLRSSLNRTVVRFEGEGRKSFPVELFEKRVAEILQKVPDDLLERPVHVTLVAQLGADPSFSFDGFTRFTLYEHFITEMVNRDTRDKPARRAIDTAPRMKFQRELAWWAWRRIGVAQGHFERDAVPHDLLQDLPTGNSSSSSGQLNEYIVSTLTEEKESGVFFFAHRSFQEFLVAQRMIIFEATPNMHSEYSRFINDDIAEFLSLAPDQTFWERWFDSLMACKGPVGVNYFRRFAGRGLFAVGDGVVDGKVSKSDQFAAVIMTAAFDHPPHAGKNGAYEEWLHHFLVDGSELCAALSAIALMRIMDGPDWQPAMDRIIAGIFTRCFRSASTDRSESPELTIDAQERDVLTDFVANKIKRVGQKSGKIKSSPYELLGTIEQWLYRERGYISPDDRFLDGDDLIHLLYGERDKQHIYRHIPERFRQAYYSFLHADRQAFPIVYVSNRQVRSSPSRR